MRRVKHRTISFEDGRRVLVTVLRDVRCDFWADRLTSVSSSSFRSLLGGMGSFNDLIICRANHHEISDSKEPLANEILKCLTEICFATSSGNTLASEDAVRACGQDSLVLTGWRCLACGFAQVSTRNTRALISADEVRNAIRSGIEQGKPAEALIQLWQRPDDNQTLRRLTEDLLQSGLHHIETDGWMRPCPTCSSNDTCVYRWRREGGRFIPTVDNLQLRGNQPNSDK